MHLRSIMDTCVILAEERIRVDSYIAVPVHVAHFKFRGVSKPVTCIFPPRVLHFGAFNLTSTRETTLNYSAKPLAQFLQAGSGCISLD